MSHDFISRRGALPEAPPLEVDEKNVSGLLAKIRLEFWIPLLQYTPINSELRYLD